VEAKRFEHIVRSLSESGPRRDVLHLLVGLPLGGLIAFLRGASGDAKRRKKRKEQDKRRAVAENHKHGGRRRKHKNRSRHHQKTKPCKAESAAQTCDGNCGQVQNNCKKPVDCGSCVCEPACPVCQTCNPETAECEPDPAQNDETCGGCRICAGGECVTDGAIVCEPLDQCHDAGVCDPATGACTIPPKANDTPCDDGDPCTTEDTCQNGECRGTPKDCSAEGDVCNDGVCRNDGTCIKEAKPNGTGCNADSNSCTAGDSCQNGACTVGAGVDCSNQDDECNRGVCRQSEGACIKDPLPDGTACGANGECRNGSCEAITCTPVGEVCPSIGACCPGSECEATFNRCSCLSNGQMCDGVDTPLTACCVGAGTCEFWAQRPDRKTCCFPDGTPCRSNETFAHSGCCGGYCNTTSGACSSTCTPADGPCRNGLECCTVLQRCERFDPVTGIGHCA
jgi:hypothetical protein